MTDTADPIVWRPSPEQAREARVRCFMAAHDLGSLADLQRRSVADP